MTENQVQRLQLRKNLRESSAGYVDVARDEKVFRFLLDQFAIEDYLVGVSLENEDIWKEGDPYLMTESESEAAQRIFALAENHLVPREGPGGRLAIYRISVEFLNDFPNLPSAPRR